MDLQSLFHQVSGLLNNQTRDNNSVNTDGLLGQVAGLFRQHGYQGEDYNAPHTGGYGNEPVASNPGYTQSDADRQAGILPASQDPLGDPADQR